MEWLDGQRIQVVPPKKPKKLTGTRFASVLGLNRWSTPFEIWCACTRTYEEPFEDTKFTIAGKAIEPKQAQYMKDAYFMRNLVTPSDIWGEDYFHKTYGDFFRDTPVFGGMWDYLLIGKDGKPTTVLEMKTSQRSEDWKDDIPEYYALQAALYAYLLGVDSVIMVASFLEPGDYDNPEKFVCTGKNTITRPFLVSERYPDFEKKYVKPALKWWKDHVETGISPVYDEKKDADILKALRTNNLSPESDITSIVKEAEELKEKLDKAAADIAADEKRYKTLTDMLKKYAQGQFRDGDKQVDLGGSKYSFVMSRTDSMKVDETALKKAGLFDQYAVPKTTYTLRVKMKEEETK